MKVSEFKKMLEAAESFEDQELIFYNRNTGTFEGNVAMICVEEQGENGNDFWLPDGETHALLIYIG